jgi:hypothetical protein
VENNYSAPGSVGRARPSGVIQSGNYSHTGLGSPSVVISSPLFTLLATVLSSLSFPNRGVRAVSGERFGDSYEVGGAARSYGGERAAAADGLIGWRQAGGATGAYGGERAAAAGGLVGMRQHRGRRRCEGVAAW